MALPKLFSLTVITMLSLSSVAHAMGGGAVKDESGRFTIAGNVPEDQSKLTVADLKYLHAMQLQSSDAELKQVMELADVNAGTMSQWLADRVQYIIGENTDLEKVLVPISERHSYENPRVLPDLERAPARPAAVPTSDKPKGKAVVVMSNIGAAIYYFGKTKSILVGMKIPGAETATISSPRTGIIQIGQGHFMALLKKLGLSDTNIESEGYTLFRLGTFFHEARHSDGNGKSLGFLHALCPEGHNFANLNACDRNLNGPYSVGALVVRSFAANCASCSAAEKEALKLEALDSFNRVIKETKRPRSSSDAYTQQVCDSLRDLNRRLTTPIELPEMCNAPASSDGDVVKSTFWDARPEGSR